jgi:hypothetical protein
MAVPMQWKLYSAKVRPDVEKEIRDDQEYEYYDKFIE